MDSSNRRVIIRKDINWPTGLTIDYSAQKIYWADRNLYKANYDGSNRESIFRSPRRCLLGYPVALTLYENKIYWTETKTRRIHLTNKSNGRPCPVSLTVSNTVKAPMDIRAYEPKRQMPRPRPGEFNFKYCCIAHLFSLRLHVDHYTESRVPDDQFITFASLMCLVAHNPFKNFNFISDRGAI